MKKNKFVKGLGMLSLCLSIAISALSASALLENTVALAEDTVQTTDFVYTGAEVTQDMSGLHISSDNAYQATFKGVFTGDTTFKFRFPETYTDALYGDFKFRITDATDDSNYFDIVYYVENEEYSATAICVEYNGEARMSSDRVENNQTWYNTKVTGQQNHKFAPCFLSKAYDKTNGKRYGVLSLEWTEDVLSVRTNTSSLQSEKTTVPVASFDGTYDESKPNNGFENKVSWGLPKINFENGYTISVSSSIEDKRTSDKGTDVLFSSMTNDGQTYNFKQDTLTQDDKMQSFDDAFKFLTTKETTEDTVFLGWKNKATNELYPAYSIVRKGETYEQVSLSFDIMDGASVRIDTSKNGRSGLRFQTVFNADEFERIKGTGFLKSFGTLVAWTDTLTKGDFTIENYQMESTFAQVENTKGTFEYTDSDGEKYAAYSMAIDVDPDHFTMEYSARGYLVVEYADGSTRTIYTDYNADDNSCTIAEIANEFKTKNPELYDTMTQAQKDVIDAYVTSYIELMNK